MEKSMRAYLIIPLLVLFAGCDQVIEKHSELRWATVDKGQLQRSMTSIIHQMNPYPEEIYFDTSTVASQLKTLRRNHKMINNECKIAPAEIDLKTAKAMSDRDLRLMLQKRVIPVLDEECLNNRDITQRLAVIEGEIKGLETLTNKRRSFDKHISNLAKEAIMEAVRNFAHGRYDLIVNTRAKEILFNNDKGVLDVTQAIVEHYRESHMPSTTPSAPTGT
jgi:hypothetical protein